MQHRLFLFLIFPLALIAVGGWLVFQAVHIDQKTSEAKAAEAAFQAHIQSVINARLEAQAGEGDSNPFAPDGIVRLLLIGLDNRSGSATGHCDAIQFLEINKNINTVNITAVPRGTYSPLLGSGHLPSDYYVSNACAIGGIDYGIAQIETILGQKADYVVMIGFSGALGAFRLLNLPTTETLQWLRLRQAYAIGEPQRAHNHSTFLKKLLLDYLPAGDSKFSFTWEYLFYRLVNTDLSFTKSQAILSALSAMDLSAHSDDVKLSMKPAYAVLDIAYDSEHLQEYLSAMLDPISDRIPEGAYTGISEIEEQQKLMDLINAGLADEDFIKRAFEQKLWLQIDDQATRESVHFALLTKHLSTLLSDVERKILLADYILEMEALGENDWAESARVLLVAIVENNPSN